jgi:hypothetical protein
MHRRRPGFESPEVVIDGANHHEFMVSTNTLAAKDTLAQVSYDERVCFLKPRVMGHRVEPYLAYTQFGSDLPQLASVSLAAHNAGLGVIGHHQTNDIDPMPFDGRGICEQYHA